MNDLSHRLNRWDVEAEVHRLRASQTRTREALALLGAEVTRLEEENKRLRAMLDNHLTTGRDDDEPPPAKQWPENRKPQNGCGPE